MPSPDAATIRILCELAHDGAWTLPQLEARRTRFNCPAIPRTFLSVTEEYLRPTGWSRILVPAKIVRPTRIAAEIARAHGIDVRSVRLDQIEHTVGLAELRWWNRVTVWDSISGDELMRTQCRHRALGIDGGFRAAPDGAYVFEKGLMLCEYDTGRYGAPQVQAKIAAARSIRSLGGRPITGHLWGAPTHARAHWLRRCGVALVTVIPPSSWLGAKPASFQTAGRPR
jgi:hypothetical protein